jgi:hypothetical protein
MEGDAGKMRTLWRRLCWICTSLEKVEKAEVEFTLYSDSGYEIAVIIRDLPIRKLLPIYYDRWGFYSREEKRIADLNRELFNKKAKKHLKEYQTRKIHNLIGGKVYGGKFVAKCLWRVDVLKTKSLTFEEYLEATKIMKARKKEAKEEENG